MSIGRNFKLGIPAATVATILTGCGTTQLKSELAARLETAEKENIALRDAGYNPGPVDCVLGRSTMAAVNAYQKANGIASGQLTVETLHRLKVI